MRERYLRAVRNAWISFLMTVGYEVLVCAYCDVMIERTDDPTPNLRSFRKKFTLCYPCWTKLHYGTTQRVFESEDP